MEHAVTEPEPVDGGAYGVEDRALDGLLVVACLDDQGGAYADVDLVGREDVGEDRHRPPLPYDVEDLVVHAGDERLATVPRPAGPAATTMSKK